MGDCRETVLVVDDDPGVRGFVSEALEREGYTVLKAGDGEEALRIFREYRGPIHLIITDVIMPRLTGPEWVRQLDVWMRGIKVLFITGNPELIVHPWNVLDRDVSFLKKPFDLSTLRRTIRAMMNGP